MKHLYLAVLMLTLPMITFSQKKSVHFDHTIQDIAPFKIQTSGFNVNLVRQLPSTLNYAQSGFTSASFANGLKAGSINERGLPRYIEGKLSSVGLKGLSIEQSSAAYLSEASALMHVNAADFKISHAETDEIGMSHVRMQQYYHNIPIYGAEVVTHGLANDFDFLNGNYYTTSQWNVSSVPTVNEAKALDIVEADLGESLRYDKDMTPIFSNTQPKTEMVIFPYQGSVYLAYHVYQYKNMVERWEYFIDAHDGTLIHKRMSICKLHHHFGNAGHDAESNISAPLDGKTTANAKDLFDINRTINTYQVGSTYYMIDATRDMFSSTAAQLPNDPSGVIWTIDALNTTPTKSTFKYDHVKSSSNTWSDKASVSAQYNGGIAYNYYKTVHNRKSINGTGGNIISIINVSDDDGSSMGNAFWNGQAMFYGNGDAAFLSLARALDVAGHEMSHGVIENTANLDYEGESGALNESFADVFGALIDRDDWKIGEDVVRTSVFPSGALRDLQNPHNGAATNNFDAGWQPKHFNERYTGTADNGGVHLNSGIPNHAFYLFANVVGKDKAEKVYYRALSQYLTKSSKFVDARIAIIKATTDLYSTTEINAAKAAFDQVGILGDSGGNYETDVNTNPGQDYVLVTGENSSGLYIYDNAGKELVKISNKTIFSKPSVTDDGTVIIYVASDHKIYYQTIDWSTEVVSGEKLLDDQSIWRNAIISKDGSKLAATYDAQSNKILVYDFDSQQETEFTLYNPTYSGVSTGDVLYADAMEFDLSGEYIMYDAENEINSTSAGSIKYWDIGFIKVWNNKTKTFSLGNIEKLFNSLNNGVSVGNPTFSKNSPYIISFDYIHENGDDDIVAANIERGELNLIFENNTLGFPNFSAKDNELVFDNQGSSATNVGVIGLKSNKIEPSNTATLFCTGRNWAVWFSNGSRNLSAVEDTKVNLKNAELTFNINQNPVIDKLLVSVNSEKSQDVVFSISTISGEVFSSKMLHINSGNQTIEIPLKGIVQGMYVLSAQSSKLGFIGSEKFVVTE